MTDRWTTMQTTESLKASSRDSERESLHESNAKYSVIYHGGLEVVDQDNAPEVVSSTSNLNRNSSLMRPEAYQAALYCSDKKGHHSYYEPPQALPHEHEGLQFHERQDGKDAMVGALEVTDNKDRRRCCGIPRKFFIIIIVMVTIIILGVVLGAVLGVVLSKDSNGNSADGGLKTWSFTGLASTLAGDDSGRMLTYFQDTDGRILENSYLIGKWTLEDPANVDLSVVTTQAAYGSQLAAISYKYDGKTYRQIFFVTSTGAIMTANSTETWNGIAQNWSVGRPITDDRVDPKGVGLAACWSDQNMNGIRAFYSSQYGYINEVKWTFGGSKWEDGEWMTSSDSKSGVGCAYKNSDSSQFLNVYYRNTGTGRVKQAYINYNYSNPVYDYHDGPRSWSNKTIAIGSDVAVCNDDSQTEYVYYQMPGGLVTRGIVNPSSSSFELFDDMEVAVPNGKLACSFVDGGSMLLFQNRTGTDSIMASDVSRSGVPITHIEVPI